MMRWAVVFWMFVVAAVSYLDRNDISIAATTIQHYYGISNVQLGAVFSAFGIGYAFTQPVAGRLAIASARTGSSRSSNGPDRKR